MVAQSLAFPATPSTSMLRIPRMATEIPPPAVADQGNMPLERAQFALFRVECMRHACSFLPASGIIGPLREVFRGMGA